VICAAAARGVDSAYLAAPGHPKAACGYGRAEKGQVQRMVRIILGLDAEPRSSHEADAFAVAICHALGSPLQGVLR
jgi:crossover junction endodeoxyribonuclease RuvC